MRPSDVSFICCCYWVVVSVIGGGAVREVCLCVTGSMSE